MTLRAILPQLARVNVKAVVGKPKRICKLEKFEQAASITVWGLLNDSFILCGEGKVKGRYGWLVSHRTPRLVGWYTNDEWFQGQTILFIFGRA